MTKGALIDENLIKIKQLLIIQGDSGNWNYNSYMLGLYNGMELVLALLEAREPMFREKPSIWLEDVPLSGDAIPEVLE